MKQSVVVALATALSAGGAQATDIDGVLRVGFDFGGDTIVMAPMDNGDTETIKANKGFFVGAGAAVFNQARTLSAEITMSWKFTGITADQR